ncbi:TPA: glycosyltransferase [Vibrio parahaemolyticus]|nr:glycosyltransferase [Vibrio diabolicus]HBK3324125.1 glycosyltransferase [Vibrio parahaemolyticus]
MENKLVTVYITTKNRRKLLERALLSVLNQTHKELDIIIVDDASSDDTCDFLDMCVRNHNNVRYFKNKMSMGACYSRNIAISQAKGKYITGLDDDDEFHSQRVEKLLKKFIDNKFSCICSSVYLIDETGERSQYKDKTGVINLNSLLTKNYIGNQVLTKTSYLRSLSGFDVGFPALQDYDMWVRLVERYGEAYKLKDYLYIVHVDHTLPRITNSNRRNLAINMFIDKHIDKMSNKQIINHKFNIKVNSDKDFSLYDFYYYPTISCFFKISKRLIVNSLCIR